MLSKAKYGAHHIFLTVYHCTVCGIDSYIKKFKLCSECGTTYYCSVECQRSDWKKHKTICGTESKTKKNMFKSLNDIVSYISREGMLISRDDALNHYVEARMSMRGIRKILAKRNQIRVDWKPAPQQRYNIEEDLLLVRIHRIVITHDVDEVSKSFIYMNFLNPVEEIMKYL